MGASRIKKFSSQFLVFIFCITTLGSCAWLTQRRALFGGDSKKGDAKATEDVSKEQYNKLLSKYENLQREKKAARIDSGEKQKSMAIMNELKEAPATKDGDGLTETVDVFGKNGMIDKAKTENLNLSLAVDNLVDEISDKDIRVLEEEISRYKKAEAALAKGAVQDAMDEFRKLQQSRFRQVQVRAQFYIGEILFMQKEYDLAMQAFEEIVNKHAFSGVVLKTLGRIIACTEKLNLKEKQDQYYAILHDFFEEA